MSNHRFLPLHERRSPSLTAPPHGKTDETAKDDRASIYDVAVLLKRPEEGITIPQAAERLGVDPQTIRNWVRTGKLPATRWGPDGAKVIRIDPADLEGLGPRPAAELTASEQA